VIIFEDLSKLGYTVPKDPYNFETGKHIYSRLAAIHATSYYLHHAKGQDFSDFKTGIFDLPPEAMDNFFGKHMEIMIDEMATWPGFEVHTEKLKTLRLHYSEVGQRITKCIPGGYNVLNHGDFHQKNTLVKLSEQNGSDEGEQVPLDYILVSVFSSRISD
jgi:Ecdysteroid kinase-like family